MERFVADREPRGAADPTTAPPGFTLHSSEGIGDAKTVPSSSNDVARVRFKEAEERPPRSRRDRRVIDLAPRVALSTAGQAPSLLESRSRGIVSVWRLKRASIQDRGGLLGPAGKLQTSKVCTQNDVPARSKAKVSSDCGFSSTRLLGQVPVRSTLNFGERMRVKARRQVTKNNTVPYILKFTHRSPLFAINVAKKC